MFKDKTLDIKKKLCIVIIISLQAIAIYYIINSYLIKNTRGTKELKYNWTISYNNTTHSNQTLQDFVFDDLKSGDVITLRHNLYDINTITAPMISFKTKKCACEVLLDKTILYSVNMKSVKDNSFCGSGYNRVAIPNTSNKKTLVIKLYIISSDPFKTLDPVIIGNSDIIYNEFLITNVFYIFLSIPTIIVGLLSMIFSLVLIKKFHVFHEFFFSSLFIIFSGLWIISTSKILQLLITDINIAGYIEHCSLYVLPLIHSLIFYHLLKHVNEKERNINKYISLSYFISYTIIIILQLFNIIHLQQMLVFVFILILFESCRTIYLLLKHKFIDSSTQLYLLKGITSFSIIVLIDIIRFVIVDAIHCTKPILNITTFPIALILYIGYCITAYISYFKTQLNSLKEQEQLEQLAYHDCLTHIYNRAKCEKIMSEFDSSLTNYCIVSIDLNDLKKINDTKGHSIGDWLLSGFAKLLGNYFSRYGYAGRIGGDEFILLLPDDNKYKDIKTLIDSFNVYVDNENKKIQEFQYSFAYGYATRQDISPASAKKVYELADSRMYENKMAMKKLIKPN